MRSASIHHHFHTKEALGNAVIDSPPEQFTHALEQPLDGKGIPTKYREFFACGLGDVLMPLCDTHAGDTAALLFHAKARTKLQRLDQISRAGVTD